MAKIIKKQVCQAMCSIRQLGKLEFLELATFNVIMRSLRITDERKTRPIKGM